MSEPVHAVSLLERAVRAGGDPPGAAWSSEEFQPVERLIRFAGLWECGR